MTEMNDKKMLVLDRLAWSVKALGIIQIHFFSHVFFSFMKLFITPLYTEILLSNNKFYMCKPNL
jgi:hypothetical protein